ncbi:MAG: CysS/YqeB C-terminal domain-containing protein [Acidimicrobiales bacterium]
MVASPRLLVLLGSGETAPTMVKPHRAIFERLGPPPVPAVVVDTPYGFQENADDISARAVDYFATSVGQKVEVAELRGRESDDPVRREASLARLAAARWAFAGPGSPTYALRRWSGSDVPALLADKLTHGGCVAFASAAALTLGRYTVPVYEIYKSGADPVWTDGLDLVAPVLGPDVAVIPHYDNAEGGTHDTRFCYLGERRLRLLEVQLPAGGWVLGVDEHTGCVLDIDAGTATVVGIGQVTVRQHGRSATVPTGTVLPIEELVGLPRRKGAASAAPPMPADPAAAPTPGAPRDVSPFHTDIRRLEEEFDAAVGARDVDGAVRAVLELDDTVRAWAADTLDSDAGRRARAALRRMVARLGELARFGAQDPRSVVGPYVEALLVERAAARAEKRWADADRVRDALGDAGVEVRDTAGGTVWQLPAASLAQPAPIV